MQSTVSFQIHDGHCHTVLVFSPKKKNVAMTCQVLERKKNAHVFAPPAAHISKSHWPEQDDMYHVSTAFLKNCSSTIILASLNDINWIEWSYRGNRPPFPRFTHILWRIFFSMAGGSSGNLAASLVDTERGSHLSSSCLPCGIHRWNWSSVHPRAASNPQAEVVLWETLSHN